MGKALLRAISLAHLTILAFSAHFPLHSWDTLPVFFHSSSMNLVSWDDADLAVIARFPAVTIEKWQGCNSTPGCYGGVPEGPCPTQQDATLVVARRLKALRPNISIVTWTDSMRIYSRPALNPDIIDTMHQSCVRNFLTPYMEAHPELEVTNTTGHPALESYIHAHVYDLTQAPVRSLWKDACLNMTASGVIDGCGADASQQNGTNILGISAETLNAWAPAHVQSVAETTAAVTPQGGYVLGKIEAQLGVSTNGVLQEGCVAGNATINALLDAAAAARAHGARYIYECHSNGTPDDLAAFLIGAGPDQYWGFGAWMLPGGIAPGTWLPEMGYPLGEPLGDAVYLHPTWTREFGNHSSPTTVTFNVSSNTGKIRWAVLSV